ncbi:MAG: Kelch repeat-containing protein [Deltaproteobacteria bacterium]
MGHPLRDEPARSPLGAWVVMALVASATGCPLGLPAIDFSGKRCGPGAESCPSGWSCGTDSTCVPANATAPGQDGGPSDAGAPPADGGDDAGFEDAGWVDGGRADGGGGDPAVAGAPCSVASDCASNACFGGVCCAAACPADAGPCGPVGCVVGTGACELAAAGTACPPGPSCPSGGTELTPGGSCDGEGDCRVPPAMSCDAGALCDGTGCAAGCLVAGAFVPLGGYTAACDACDLDDAGNGEVAPVTGAAAPDAGCPTVGCSAGACLPSFAPIPTARTQVCAALGGDGRIYVVGGRSPMDGGSCAALSVAERYDPQQNQWVELPPLPLRVAAPGCVATPTGILVLGGYGAPTNGAAAFDPDAGAWVVAPPLSQARGDLGVAIGGDGRIYAIGGSDDSTILGSVESLATDGGGVWSPAPPLQSPRAHFAACADAQGRIYAIGGSDKSAAVTSSVEMLNPRSPHPAWSYVAALNIPRENHGCALGPDGDIYVFGGRTGAQAGNQLLLPTERFTPDGGWALLSGQVAGRAGLGVAPGAGPQPLLYAIGGSDQISPDGGYCLGDAVPTVQAFSTVTQSF